MSKGMTKEEAIEYFKSYRKIVCEDHLKICPKDSIAYQATLKEKEFYDMAIKALEQQTSEACVSIKTMLDAITEIDGNINMDIYTNEVRELIKDLPPVTPARKKGRWIKVTETDFGIGYQCSECGRFILTESIDEKKLKDFPYCHCGAEMESEE